MDMYDKLCQCTFLTKNLLPRKTIKTIVFDFQGIYIYIYKVFILLSCPVPTSAMLQLDPLSLLFDVVFNLFVEHAKS